MTRETAKRKIEMLDSYLQRVNDYGESDHEAMMMAIKALEKPSIEVLAAEDVAIVLGCQTFATTAEWLYTLTTLEKCGYAICKVEGGFEMTKEEKLRDCPYIAKKCKSEDCKGYSIHETMRGSEDERTN